MSEQKQTRKKSSLTSGPAFTPRSGLIQRKCACGGSAGVDGECAECRSKRLSVQRSPATQAEPTAVPPVVHEVLSSPGQPLDADTRAYMEPRFGHDFSKVRVHADGKAAESAQAINALAYTAGRDIAFDKGQYALETTEGKKLLAHELTHVVQQESAAGIAPLMAHEDAAEIAAQSAAREVIEQGRSPVLASAEPGIARAEAEIASTKRVNYEPNEREESKSSPGWVESQGERKFELFNFGVNEDGLKPEHELFLSLLVERFKLREAYPATWSPQQEEDYPHVQVRLIEGYTDLVDTEAVNAPLRQRRAESVVQSLVIKLGVPSTNIDVFRGAPTGSLLAGNTTREGRARNRSVVIELESITRVPKHQETDLEHQKGFSRHWSLRSIATAAGGIEGVGGGGGIFQLKNLSSGEPRSIVFTGLGIAGTPEIKKLPNFPPKKFPPRMTASVPSETQFETTRPHTFEDFQGFGFIDMLSVDVIAIGYQLGWAHFLHIETTEHKGIWIGGPQMGSLGISGSILLGGWKLQN